MSPPVGLSRLELVPFPQPTEKIRQKALALASKGLEPDVPVVNVREVCRSKHITFEHWVMVDGHAISSHQALFVWDKHEKGIILSPYFQTSSEENLYWATILGHRVLHLKHLHTLTAPQVLFACSVTERCRDEALTFAGWLLLAPVVRPSPDEPDRYELPQETVDTISAKYKVPVRLINHFLKKGFISASLSNEFV